MGTRAGGRFGNHRIALQTVVPRLYGADFRDDLSGDPDKYDDIQFTDYIILALCALHWFGTTAHTVYIVRWLQRTRDTEDFPHWLKNEPQRQKEMDKKKRQNETDTKASDKQSLRCCASACAPKMAPAVIRRRRRPSKGGSMDQLQSGVGRGDQNPKSPPLFSDRACARLGALARGKANTELARGKANTELARGKVNNDGVIGSAELETELIRVEGGNQ